MTEAFLIAVNRRQRERLFAGDEPDRRIVLVEAALDLDSIPGAGVANVVDAHVVMRAPEERHRVEFFPLASFDSGMNKKSCQACNVHKDLPGVESQLQNLNPPALAR